MPPKSRVLFLSGAGFDDRSQPNSLDEISTIQATALLDDAKHTVVKLVPCLSPGATIYMVSNLCEIHTDHFRGAQASEPNDNRKYCQHMICELKTS